MSGKCPLHPALAGIAVRDATLLCYGVAIRLSLLI